MTGGYVGWLIALWIIPIFVAIPQGRPKDRAGLAYGIFLGWIGIVMLAYLPPRKGDATHSSVRTASASSGRAGW